MKEVRISSYFVLTTFIKNAAEKPEKPGGEPQLQNKSGNTYI